MLRNSTLIVVAIVYGFALWMSAFAGLLGIPLWILVTLSLWRYAYDVLRHVAQGHALAAVAPSIESMAPLPGRGVVLHCLLFVALLYLLATTPLIGDTVPAIVLRVAGIAVLAFVFPASAALIGMGGSMGGALNPVDLAECIRTFGRDYAVLIAVCLGLVGGAFLLEGVVAPLFGGFAGLITEIGLAWILLALFALIGAAIHAHRFDFAIPGEYEPERERAKRHERAIWQQTIDRAYAAFRSELPAKGHTTLRRLLEAEQRSLEIYQFTFDALSAWADQRPALHFAAGYVARLLEAGLEHEALELFSRCRRRSDRFAIEPQLADALVAYARSIGRHGIADELCDAASRLPAAPAQVDTRAD